MNVLVRWAVVASSVVGTVASGVAQSGNQQGPESGYTLHANAREVVTDVTVTDSKGNPIHGLSESAFHIFDNGKLQRVVTFEEHTGAESASPVQENAGNVYSNELILQPPRAFNLILIDTSSLGWIDQAYLNFELEQFIKQLPSDEPFAVLARRGHLQMFAGFTADHQRLIDAVHAVIPRFERSMDGYENPSRVVDEPCDYLRQFPGRKNVFWFQGASGLALRPDPTSFVNYQDMSVLYDELESARIALYPVDVRGIQAVTDPLIAADPSMFEHLSMEDEADATGGHAVINKNDIAGEVKHLADNDASFYTLTYTPQDVKLDNKWHKITVQVDSGNYQLSYRRGYFDDGWNLAHAEGSARKRLLQGGTAVTEVRMTPIALQVHVVPAEQVADLPAKVVIHSSTDAPKKGERRYDLHYSVPLDVFPTKIIGTQSQLELGLGVLAFDQHSRPVSRIVDKVTLSVSQEHIDSAGPDARIGFDQQINLPNGEDFIYVAVWNMDTGRFGAVQIPLVVDKSQKR